MTASNLPIFPSALKAAAVQFSTLDTTGVYKTVYVGGNASNGSRVFGLWASQNDSSAHSITVQFQRSGTNYGGITTTIAASAGFSTSATVTPINLLSPTVWPGLPVDNYGNPYVHLASTLDSLVATFSTAISTGISGVINISGAAEDF